MIVTRPDVREDGLYNISQTALALHVDRHTVTRYAKEGCIRFRLRKAGGQKVTTGKEIMRCWKTMYK